MTHKPVMVDEIAAIFADVPGGTIIDATYGLGGHTRALEKNAGGRFRFVGIDRDGEILKMPETFRSDRVSLRKMNFAEIPSMVAGENLSPITGVLFDLGLNSVHLDDPSRGFSYQTRSLLDLRFDRSSGEPAAVIMNRMNKSELAEILTNLGQQKKARAIARRMMDERPSTTDSLADLIRGVVGSREFSKAAARVFQALRIYINDELDFIEKALNGIIPLLAGGGRVAVISYHSLEDGIVKRVFLRNAGRCSCGPQIVECNCGKRDIIKIIARKPIRPAPEEIKSNPRARSARLRYAERIKT